jgi:hypothetical protein
MKRRDLLSAGVAVAASTALPSPSASATIARPRPGRAGWPNESDWAGLKKAVGGRLAPVNLPDLRDHAVRELVANPFYVGDQPGLTQSSGWLGAWRSSLAFMWSPRIAPPTL